jgi:hypothetical protein
LWVPGAPSRSPGALGAHRPEPYWIDDATWSAKIDAIGEYKSQHAALWPGVTDYETMLDTQARDLAEALGGSGRCELYWRASGPTDG